MQNQNKFHYKAMMFLSFAGPAVILFSAVVIVPFIFGLYLTFTGWDGISSSIPFVGFENYLSLFKDTSFWISLGRTILYAVIAVILANVVAFALAYLVTSKIKGSNFFRAAFFTPNLIGGIVLGYIWQFVFNKVIVYFGDALNVTVLQKSMLSGSASAFAALVLVTIWQFSGYMMLIYIAGLTGVSEDLKEAAKIDGCNESQTTRYIVLPLMRASFTICMFLTITRCFMIYDVNLSLTEGGPYGSTVMAAMYVFQKAFSAKQYGVGQTEAIILFIFTAVIAVSQTIINKRKEVEA